MIGDNEDYRKQIEEAYKVFSQELYKEEMDKYRETREHLRTPDGYYPHRPKEELMVLITTIFNKTEERLLRLMRGLKLTKKHLATYLTDERKIFRDVARIRLQEMEDESKRL